MQNAVMYNLSLYDVIGITRHLHIKLKSFSKIAQPLHKEAVRRCSFSLITAKKSVIMSEAFFVDVSIVSSFFYNKYHTGTMRSLSLVIGLVYNNKIRTLWLMVAELKWRCMATPRFLKSQSYKILLFIRKKVLNQYLLSKAKG